MLHPELTCSKRRTSIIALIDIALMRDWTRLVGSYGNNTRVICWPAQGRPEIATCQKNKSRGCCCRNSRPTVFIPYRNMIKQRINVFTTKILSNLHQIERRRLLASIVASRISPWRRELLLYTSRREERRQARKTVRPVNVGRVIFHYLLE